MKVLRLVSFIVLTVAATPAQTPLDGPGHRMQDPLLDGMAGSWKLTGTIAGQPADQTVTAEWILDHQFLRIHEKSNAPAKDGSIYEAFIFVGYDNASERYVAHWIDVFGGRSSETLGFGVRDGNAIRFRFEYPDGPFRTAFIWDENAKSWRWEMDAKGGAPAWKEFGRMTLVRAQR